MGSVCDRRYNGTIPAKLVGFVSALWAVIRNGLAKLTSDGQAERVLLDLPAIR